MKSERKFKTVAIALSFLLLIGIFVKLYMKDSKTVQEAIVVRAYLVNFCMENARYPKKEEFDQRFPRLAAAPNWSYWLSKDLKVGNFQYPMTLPLFSAPGDSKISEFMPVIYAYAVRNPCQTFSRELL